MPKHKTRNIFYRITWEVNSLCNIIKEKKLSKNSIKTATSKLVPDPFMFAKNYTQPLLGNEIFEASN